MQNNNTFVLDLTTSHGESTDPSDQNAMAIDDDILTECLAHFPTLEQTPLPLSYEACAAAQATDAKLQQKLATEPKRFLQQLLAPDVHVIVNKARHDAQ